MVPSLTSLVPELGTPSDTSGVSTQITQAPVKKKPWSQRRAGQEQRTSALSTALVPLTLSLLLVRGLGLDHPTPVKLMHLCQLLIQFPGWGVTSPSACLLRTSLIPLCASGTALKNDLSVSLTPDLPEFSALIMTAHSRATTCVQGISIEKRRELSQITTFTSLFVNQQYVLISTLDNTVTYMIVRTPKHGSTCLCLNAPGEYSGPQVASLHVLAAPPALTTLLGPILFLPAIYPAVTVVKQGRASTGSSQAPRSLDTPVSATAAWILFLVSGNIHFMPQRPWQLLEGKDQGFYFRSEGHSSGGAVP